MCSEKKPLPLTIITDDLHRETDILSVVSSALIMRISGLTRNDINELHLKLISSYTFSKYLIDIYALLGTKQDFPFNTIKVKNYRSINNAKEEHIRSLYMTKENNLWILTEERPKNSVLQTIIERFSSEHNIGFFGGHLRIIPLVNNKKFTFTYQVLGFDSPNIDNIYIKTVSGYSSFVDFLVYFQEGEPTPSDTPLYAIEETKTADSESRNTGVYQRCTKFVYIDYFYKDVKKIMLYDLQIPQKVTATQTNIFGSRLLVTCGVEVLGKTQTDEQRLAFSSIDELIQYKSSMRKPPAGNVPIDIIRYPDRIEISGRLVKNQSLSHDPNIGALSIISKALRVLGWNKDIVLTRHGLEQKMLKPKNKFIHIANRLNIKLQDLNLPKNIEHIEYWKYEEKGEKLATIFIHLVVESFTQGYSIFENHAGCEKSYFKNSNGSVVPLGKYSDRKAYKAGDKSKIIHIPDLILVDVERLQVINIEGKTYNNRLKGIAELNNYDFIESEYIKPQYPRYSIQRTVVIYGSEETNIKEVEISFLLNTEGRMILNITAPKLFNQAIENLLNYWKKLSYKTIP